MWILTIEFDKDDLGHSLLEGFIERLARKCHWDRQVTEHTRRQSSDTPGPLTLVLPTR